LNQIGKSRKIWEVAADGDTIGTTSQGSRHCFQFESGHVDVVSGKKRRNCAYGGTIGTV
jgi:hypothetical protein